MSNQAILRAPLPKRSITTTRNWQGSPISRKSHRKLCVCTFWHSKQSAMKHPRRIESQKGYIPSSAAPPRTGAREIEWHVGTAIIGSQNNDGVKPRPIDRPLARFESEIIVEKVSRGTGAQLPRTTRSLAFWRFFAEKQTETLSSSSFYPSLEALYTKSKSREAKSRYFFLLIIFGSHPRAFMCVCVSFVGRGKRSMAIGLYVIPLTIGVFALPIFFDNGWLDFNGRHCYLHIFRRPMLRRYVTKEKEQLFLQFWNYKVTFLDTEIDIEDILRYIW